MKIAADINCYHGLYTLEETVEILAEAGFDAIDFSFMEPAQYDESTDGALFRQKFSDLRKFAEDKGLRFIQSHAPGSPASDDPAEAEAAFRNVARAIRNASWLGAEIIVVHPIQHLDYTQPGVPERLFEMNMKFYNRLKPYCEEYGIRVALENVCQGKYLPMLLRTRYQHSACSTPEEFIRYLDTLNSECFVGCFDIGHCMMVHQQPEAFIRALGHDRVKAIHVHDGDGDTDLHTLPYLGGMADWDAITDALREIRYDGVFNFEAGNFLKPLPKELYPAGARMMAETGKYLARKITG